MSLPKKATIEEAFTEMYRVIDYAEKNRIRFEAVFRLNEMDEASCEINRLSIFRCQIIPTTNEPTKTH